MSLDVEVGLKNARFRQGLEQMRGQARQFSGDLKGMFLGAFSIAGITAFAGKMREVQKEALRFHTSAESIQRIGKAARESNVDFDMLAKSINKVTLEAGKAARGGTEQARTFQLLGIDAKAFVGMSLDEKLMALSKAFKDSESSGMKTSAMLELLGGRGSEIIPLLARGPDALGKSMKDATVQTNQTVAAMAQLDRSIKKIEASAGRVLGSVMSAYTKVVGYIAAATNSGNYDDAAKTELQTENMRRRHSGEKEIVGDDAIAWKAKRAKELRQKDVNDGVNEVGKEEDESTKPVDDFTKDQGKNAPEAKEALEKTIAEEEARNRVDALSGEARLNELMKQRAALASQINDNTSEGLEAKKQDLGLERQISDLKKSEAEKLAAAKDKEAEVKEKQALDKMTPEQKAAYLEKKQAGFFAQANQMENGSAEAKAKRDAAAKATGDAKSYDAAEKAAKGSGDKDGARGFRTDKLASRQQAAQLNAEADKLDQNADPVKAVETRIKAEELQSEIDAAKKDAGKDDKSAQAKTAKDGKADADKTQAKFTVSADSMQRAGGGGRAYGLATDPAMRARDKTNQLLQKLVDASTAKNGAPKGDAPEPY